MKHFMKFVLVIMYEYLLSLAIYEIRRDMGIDEIIKDNIN